MSQRTANAPRTTTREAAWALEMHRLLEALQTLDAPALHALTPLMRAHPNVRVRDDDAKHNTERPWSKQGVRLTGPPLCVLLERLKLRRATYDFQEAPHVAQANAALTVVATEWDVDLNRPWEATEVRPQFWVDWRERGEWRAPYDLDRYREAQWTTRHTMASTPLSWLMYKRKGAEWRVENVLAHMRRLLELGADPNQPFHFQSREEEEEAGPPPRQQAQPPPVPRYSQRRHLEESRAHDAAMNALHGRSLLSVAMGLEPDMCMAAVSLLLEFGARFGSRDAHPLNSALETLPVEEAVALFHRYWQAGQITAQDILGRDPLHEEGNTAMHTLVHFPPHNVGDAETAVRQMLEMGFTPRDTNGVGVTVLALAEERAQSMYAGPWHAAVLRILREEHDAYCRTMSMAAQHSLRGAHEGRLPPEAVHHIGHFLREEDFFAPGGLARASRAEARIRAQFAPRHPQ